MIETLYPKGKTEIRATVLEWYRRLGLLPLLICSIPLIGSVLTIEAGMAGIGRSYFLIFVFLSRVIRTWFLVLIFSGIN